TVSGQGIPLQRVSSAGGAPVLITTIGEEEVGQRWPQVLPGGRALLYTATSTAGSYADASLVVQPSPNGPRKVLVRGGYFGRYVRSGHIVYVHDGTLFAAPFDAGRLELEGQFVPATKMSARMMQTGGPNHPQFSPTGRALAVVVAIAPSIV